MFPIVPLMILSSSTLHSTFFLMYFSQSILKTLYCGQNCRIKKGKVNNLCFILLSFFHQCGTNKMVDKINGIIIMYPRVFKSSKSDPMYVVNWIIKSKSEITSVEGNTISVKIKRHASKLVKSLLLSILAVKVCLGKCRKTEQLLNWIQGSDRIKLKEIRIHI